MNTEKAVGDLRSPDLMQLGPWLDDNYAAEDLELLKGEIPVSDSAKKALRDAVEAMSPDDLLGLTTQPVVDLALKHRTALCHAFTAIRNRLHPIMVARI